jgi:mono/diheme cytochrome c family protein
VSRRILFFLAAATFSVLLPLLAQNPSPTEGSHREGQRAASKQKESRGEAVFKRNCARCHEAPQGFPPQIAGTIIRHMRVRASLSAQDEKAVMEFMNP